MSTIDRAIQKLEGGAVDESAEEDIIQQSDETLAEKLDAETADETLVATPPAEDQQEATSELPESEQTVADEQSSPAVEETPSDPQRVVAAEASTAFAGKGISNYVDIDFERLSAAGFMIPGMPDNHMTEEYQQIKRRLLGNMVEGMSQTAKAPNNLVMITSSVPGEGKTFTSVNLILSIAKELDRTVLAVDTDIIKSDMSRLLGVKDRTGLFDLLEDETMSLSDVLVKTNVPNLTILPAGQAHGGISEKLASESMFRLVNELAARYKDRVIIFDCPPVLATSGAAALAPYIGQIVMVTEAVKTPQGIIKHAMQNLEHVQVTGMVLNKSRMSHPISDYQYGYYYQQQKKS